MRTAILTSEICIFSNNNDIDNDNGDNDDDDNDDNNSNNNNNNNNKIVDAPQQKLLGNGAKDVLRKMQKECLAGTLNIARMFKVAT